MNSKEDILNNIKSNIHSSFDMPDLSSVKGIQYEDILQQFVEMTKIVGGKVVILKEGDDLNASIRSSYPDAKVIASNVPEVTIATVNPDEVNRPQELNGTDLTIVEGKVGVAENGCIWIPQATKEKAAYFIAESLAILLPADSIVNNMHEAYKRIEFNDYGFGTFISGPSKTADIEQALVMGAQSAREVTVIIRL